MSTTQAAPPFPRGALIGAAALVGLTMVSAATARLTGYRQDRPAAAVLEARDLLFEDQPDGGVQVRDARTSEAVAVLAPGTNGFIRASLRSLATRRRLDGQSSQVFHLTAWSDGRLTLDDPAGSNPVELEAFGHTNAEAFAALLKGSAPR